MFRTYLTVVPGCSIPSGFIDVTQFRDPEVRRYFDVFIRDDVTIYRRKS